jgi:hypothetical protein
MVGWVSGQSTSLLHHPRHKGCSSYVLSGNQIHYTGDFKEVFVMSSRQGFTKLLKPRKALKSLGDAARSAPLRLIDVANPGPLACGYLQENALLKSSLTSNGRRVARYDATLHWPSVANTATWLYVSSNPAASSLS